MSQKEALSSAVNRIVIGDVGSGKTIVSFIIAILYLTGLKKGQVALLAPTEVLAFQHHNNLLELQKTYQKIEPDHSKDFTIIYLTSKVYYLNGEKTTKGKLEKILADEKTKPEKIFWLGTHALLYNEHLRPDLTIVDEQHRFGVKQRQMLNNKTEPKDRESKQNNLGSHFISFTATPIPRTLALTLYKNLKPTFLEALGDRKEIATRIYPIEEMEQRIIPEIKQTLSKGKKVYVICPRIEESEEEESEEMWSVQKTGKLLNKYFPDNLLTVHGKMAEKKSLLQKFKESAEKNILIATTVVEVGVDIGEATLMIIMNAERFGLSALHQIRGRIGRNDYNDNLCILATYKKYSRARRLGYMCSLHNGFELAEKDLQLRGSGDLIGTRQSGFTGEIEEILGLDPNLYYQISDLVESLDLADPNLPRLQKYLEKQAKTVWEE